MDLRGCIAAAQLIDLKEVQRAVLPAGTERLRDASAASRGGKAPANHLTRSFGSKC
jgi:hypothetical protein